MNNEENLEFMCEKVRIAISAGDELDEQMKSHLEECEECRTFLEQSEIMTSELTSMGFDTFTKDGRSVADAVMAEIERQEMFTNGSPVKANKGIFRHIGLIAACAVIMVMALPFMNSIIGAKNDSMEAVTEDTSDVASGYSERVYENNSAVLFAEPEEGPGEECADEAVETELETADNGAGASLYSDTTSSGSSGGASENIMMFMAPSSNSAVFAESSAENGVDGASSKSEDEYDDIRVKGASMRIYKEHYHTEDGGTGAESVTVEDGIYEWASMAVSEDIEMAALKGAVAHSGSLTLLDEDSLEITFADDGNTAYAVYALNDGTDITVYLMKIDGMWNVVKVCNGDITE